MEELERTQVDTFNIKESVNLEELKNNNEINRRIISIEKVFENKKKITIKEDKLKLLLNGVKLTYNMPDEVYRIYRNNTFLGLGIIKDNLLKRDVII